MATINIQITAPVQALKNYANDLGYHETVVTGQDSNGDDVMGPNPESQAEFLGRQIKTITARALAKRQYEAIEREKKNEELTEKQNRVDTIESAITVTIE